MDNINVISPEIPKSSWVKLDLSPNNPKIVAQGQKNPIEFNDFLFNEIAASGAKAGYGGYFEERRWYQQSEVFDDGFEPRTIHLGLDIWVASGTAVVSPLDGKVHSFKDNNQFLDYGPTIILEHELNGFPLYSLYGHLSPDPLEGKVVGQFVKKDEVIAWIGSTPTNGDWPPHLHFQLMKDLMGYCGDFPGVCAQSKREFYAANCPDPEKFLGL